jgi:hypothetical protein
MALISCPECKEAVSTEAASCPNCGKPMIPGTKVKKKPPPVTASGCISIVILFAACIFISRGCSKLAAREHAEAKPLGPNTGLPIGGTLWKGPAPWVETLGKLIRTPNEFKAKSKARDGDRSLTLYDLNMFQDGLAGCVSKVDGNAGAWSWQMTAKNILLIDLAPSEQIEFLFKTESGNFWYQLRSGEFKDNYVRFNPSQSPPQLLMLTPLFTQLENQSEIQPWLCSNGRVAGKHYIDEIDLYVSCERLVRKNLKAPSTAEFQGLLDGRETPSFFGNCDQEWNGWVESKNAFNVPLRTNFQCTYRAVSQQVEVRFAK